MIKAMTFFLCVLFCTGIINAQSIHNQSIIDVDGNTINLSTYQGKKVLFFIAPTNPSDFNFIELDSFYRLNNTKIKFVGILPKEVGHNDSTDFRIKSFYAAKGINIVLTKSMNVETASNNQGDLAKWLSKKSMNLRFDTEVKQGMYKFFIDQAGVLYEVFPPEVPLFSVPVITALRKRL